MAVKIFIGGEDSVPELLAKQKASWEKLEKSTDDFGRSTAKAQRTAIAYGKSLVKQNRTAEQTLKDRVKAVQEAAKKEAISQQEKIDTIRAIIGKYREEKQAAKRAAIERTDAFKKQAAEAERGARKTRELIDSTKTLAQKNRELKLEIVSAYRSGKISAGEMSAAIGELDKRQQQAKKNSPFLSDAVNQVQSYALGVASVGTAIQLVRTSFQEYREEVRSGREETLGLAGQRKSLLQVSDETNFSQRLKRVDDSAIRFGVDREKASEALFDAISNGVEQDFERILRADRVIPAEIAAKFVGEFREVFARDKLTADQSLNLGLAAASTSKFNVQELQPQIRTAAQGSSLLPGVEASDVAAFVSVLATKFGDRTGTSVRALQANIGAELIKQKDALQAATSETEKRNARQNVELLSGSLPKIIRGLSENRGLRDNITGGNKEVLTTLTVAQSMIGKIDKVDRFIEKQTSLAGTENSLVSRRLNAFLSVPKFATDFLNKQQEVRRKISAEEAFSSQEAVREFRSNTVNAQLNETEANIVQRGVANGVVTIANLVESTFGLGAKASQERMEAIAKQQADEMIKQTAILENLASKPDRTLSSPGRDQ